MKKSFTPAVIFICIFLTLHAYSQLPAVVKDWAKFAGNQDSTFKAPIVSDDSGYTYVGTFTVDSITGADILVVKYDSNGNVIWSSTWSGGGNGRDQASGITVDEKSVYVCGITYTSTANNYDYVTLCLSKKTGAINWVSTYNGSASNFDIATAIAVNDSGVYVTGISNDSNTTLDYMTVKYSPITGVEGWRRVYDYDSLDDIPFAIAINYDTIVVVTGGSQRNQYDWDYATISYSAHGTRRDTVRVTGSAAGFDRATAVKTDASGNIYITGTISQTTSGYDIKTVKINPNGTVAWQATYDNSNGTDEGVDLIVDASGNVYICGKSYSSAHNFDYVIRKYNSNGTVQWTERADLTDGVDEPRKMCFDSYGNIVVTGKGYNSATESFDFFTVALSPSGDKVWRESYGIVTRGDDGAEDIAADNNGNIYVTGEVILELGTNPQTVTIKYRTDYYTDPQQVDTPSVANYFYPNYGQIANEDGKGISEDDLHYYTVHHYPQLYFQAGKMNMVFSKIDQDTSTTDTLQRVDVSFLNSNNETKAIPKREEKDSVYLNYFLAHCPDGITNVTGNEKLLYSDIYGDIDAIYSSNRAGLKLYFVCKPYSDPGNIGLLFEGQDDLQIVNNWGLQVQTSIGNYEFEKPRVYQLDTNGNIIALTWLLSWNISQAGQAEFTGWGTYDHGKTLVIEIGRTLSNPIAFDHGLCWSTYWGGADGEYSFAITNDQSNNTFITGSTVSADFPTFNGLFQTFNANQKVFVSKFNSNDNQEWSTYWGGTDDQEGYDIKCKNNGDVYFCGYTLSGNFNRTANGNAFIDNSYNGNAEGFISCLNSSGNQIVWSTYFGSVGIDHVYSLDFDNSGNLFVVGDVGSVDSFPTRSPSGFYSQSFGSSRDAFIAKFDNNDSLLWSTFYGGSSYDWATSVKTDNSGGITIQGGTQSNNFPHLNPGNGAYIDSTLGGNVDDFIIRFDSLGRRKWASLVGGSGDEFVTGFGTYAFPGKRIAFDSHNNIYLVGSTESSDFHLHNDGGFYDSTFANHDGYIMKFDGSNFSLLWSSYISGAGQDEINSVCINSNDVVFCTGGTSDSLFWTQQHSAIYYQDSLSGFGSTYADDGLIIAFDEYHNLIYGTYFGGYTNHPEGDFITSSCIQGTSLFLTGYTSASGSSGTKKFPLFASGNSYIDTVFGGTKDCFVSQICIQNVVGINEVSRQNAKIICYPNPTMDELSLQLDLNKNEKLKIFVFNTLEEKVEELSYKGLSGENSIYFNTSKYTSGVYFIEVIGEQTKGTVKFIKL